MPEEAAIDFAELFQISDMTRYIHVETDKITRATLKTTYPTRWTYVSERLDDCIHLHLYSIKRIL